MNSRLGWELSNEVPITGGEVEQAKRHPLAETVLENQDPPKGNENTMMEEIT